MASKVNNQSITLKMYVDLLRRAGDGSLGYIQKLQGLENRAARELVKSGLISEDLIEFEHARAKIAHEASLTPEGVAALESWAAYLKELSFTYKVGDTFMKLLWVLIGAIAASLPRIIELLAS